ncbi:MAG: competence/damage-inducible protein A [Cryomorphaceae bacterium]|nr:competence/damage-inducible protein A [Cryomorphaceae bacterium]
MQAEVITIGDEILIGQIVDTNSAWLGKLLNNEGIDIHQIRSIRDTSDDIGHALKSLHPETELVVFTGGLGPTRDDKTKQTLADYFGVSLTHHPEVERHIEQLFSRFNREVNKFNRSQAWLPANCIPLFNEKGTAPGMMFRENGLLIFSLPGVPYEMKHLMEDRVIPLIREKMTIHQEMVHRTLLTQGVPESILADKLQEFEDQLPPDIKLAYLPSPGRVRLRLSGKAPKGNEIKSRVEGQFAVLHRALAEIVYGEGDEEMEEIVGSLLREKGKTIGVAESCTGGYISHLITRVPGCSDYFRGSLVTYAYDLKENLLNVPNDILLSEGAVSQPVVIQMAKRAAEVLNVDYAISTSGIAGPGGATDEKPVGLVWIGIRTPESVKAYQFQFNGDRERIIRKASLMALDILRRALVGKSEFVRTY